MNKLVNLDGKPVTAQEQWMPSAMLRWVEMDNGFQLQQIWLSNLNNQEWRIVPFFKRTLKEESHD